MEEPPVEEDGIIYLVSVPLDEKPECHHNDDQVEPAVAVSDEKVALDQTYTVEDAVEYAGLGLFQFVLFNICGVLMAADAMEMLLLSILGPALRCRWHLTSHEIALITTVVFIGFLFGAPLWGYISDNYGRWPTFFTVLSMISLYGYLTAISPTYTWLIILRFMVGFAIGGASTSFTLMSEFLPRKHRAKILLSFQVFWAAGSTLEVGTAYIILPRFGWRWLVFASALPLSVFLVLLKFLPESPRYLVMAGRMAEAEKVIKLIFQRNRVEPLPGRLESSVNGTQKLGSFVDLFNKNYIITTCMITFTWFGAAFGYYGVVLLSAEIFRFRQHCYGTWGRTPDFYGNWTFGDVPPSEMSPPKLDTSCCQELTHDDFVAMIISSIGEFVNIPLMILVIDFFGRRITIGLWNGLSGIMFLLMYICMPRAAMMAVLFTARIFAAGLPTLAYLYTAEVYPTPIRAVAVGVFSSIARIGAITTPYVAQVMMPEVSQIGALVVYASVAILCSILAFLLPIETAGRELPSTFD